MTAQHRQTDNTPAAGLAPYELFGLPTREPVRSLSRAERQTRSRATGRVQRRLAGIQAVIERRKPVPGRTVWYAIKALMPDEFPVTDQKVARRSSQKLSGDIARLRRTGVIGWGDVTDIMSIERAFGYQSPESVLRALSMSYQQDYWADMPHRVAVTIESEQMWDALRQRLDDIPAPLYGLGGHPSLPLKADLAAWLGEADEAIVLHVGDADGMGFEIQRTLAAGIAEHGVAADVRRVWLYTEQAEQLDLPRRVLSEHADKEMDLAWGFGPGDAVYEAEAEEDLDYVADLIRAEVNRLLDPDRQEQVADANRTARDLFRRLIPVLGEMEVKP